MMLYHGTSESRAKKILVRGIRPRGRHGKTNWKHSVESNPRAVYLTDAYPGHFAIQAAKKGERLAILEIDTERLDKSKLHPDEDLLEQSGRHYDALPADWSIAKRTRWYRAQAPHNSKWELSLQGMGTVGYYGVIPPEAITCVVYFDPATKGPAQDFYWALGDTSVSMMNYMILAPTHKARLRYLFNEPVTAEELANMPLKVPKDFPPEFKAMVKRAKEHYTALLADRSAIEIVNLNGKEVEA